MTELSLHRVVSVDTTLVNLTNCKTLDLVITLEDGTKATVILFHDKDVDLKLNIKKEK